MAFENNKKQSKKLLALALSAGLIANSFFSPVTNLAFADSDENKEEVVEEIPADNPMKNGEEKEKGKKTDNKGDEKEKKGEEKPADAENEGKDSTPKNETSSIADVLSAEQNTLSNDSIYRIRIGYEFEDGSFDEWASGTGFLVGDKYILTTQSLSDTTTTSPLFKRIAEERAAAYTKIGVSLSDAEKTEKNIKIKIYDTSGKEKTVTSSIAENGIGVIVINQPEPSVAAVFEDADKIDVSDGSVFNIKYTQKSNSQSDVEQISSMISSEKEGNKENTFGLTVDNIGDQNTIGSPVLNEKGNVAGMVMIHGDVVTAIQGNVLQTFLTNNGIKFNTASSIKNKMDQDLEDQAKKEVDDAVKSNLDPSKLEKAISDAEAVEREKYLPDSLAILDESVKKGKEVLESEEKTQAQIDAATDNINKSIETLQVDDSTFIDKHKNKIYIGIAVVVIAAVLITIRNAKKKEQARQEEKALEKAKEAENSRDEDGLSELLGTSSKAKSSSSSNNSDDDELFPEGFDDIVDNYNSGSRTNKSANGNPEYHDNYNNQNFNNYNRHQLNNEQSSDSLYESHTPTNNTPNNNPYASFGDPYAENYHSPGNPSIKPNIENIPRMAKTGEDNSFYDEGLDVTNQVAPKNMAMSRYKDIDGIDYVKPEYDDDEIVSDLSKERIDPYGIEGAKVYKDLGDGDDETTILNNAPFLVRVDNGQQIPIYDNFILGKQKKKVNYCITGNSSISREHARIRVINGDYCLEDLKSKNYTYIGGKQIPAYSPVKLKDGMSIRLSDVEFVFHQN